jgi:hypothetical protein
MPRTFAVTLASSSKVSKKSPMRKRSIVSGYFAFTWAYCFIKGVDMRDPALIAAVDRNYDKIPPKINETAR